MPWFQLLAVLAQVLHQAPEMVGQVEEFFDALSDHSTPPPVHTAAMNAVIAEARKAP